jgi:Bacterial TSP3 repeat
MPLPQKKLIPGILLALVLSASAAPPIWWSEGNPPVLNANPANNKGPANIGQAKHMAKSALDALYPVLPDVAAQIEADLVGSGKTIPSWAAPANQAEKEKNHAPLLIGQLKAIADPFYTRLHAVSPHWLEAERTTNGTNHPGSIFPWTSAVSDDNNKGVANIGQLKAVFSLRFEGLVAFDADGDGLPDLWEIAHGFDPNDPADAYSDPDGDGIINQMELALGTDPNSFDQIGPVNIGFNEEITDSPDFSFRPENPSDLYPEDSVAHWSAAIGQHIEIWDEGDGNPYAELQSHWDAKGIEQEFDMLPGTRLTFILRYKGRYDGYSDSNPFKLKVEGAYEVLVNGQPAQTLGSVKQESFMADDEWEKYAEWHYATVAITAAPQATTLVPITLTLIPEDTDEAITYGGFVDLVNVEVVDNVIATGVDRISKTVSMFDRGFEGDYWIMAPLQGPGSFTYENLTKFQISMGGSDRGILSCENATPVTVMDPSNQIALDGQPQDVLWQGVGTGVDSEKVVKLKINGSDTETSLPVKVKAMKYREVAVAVHVVNELKSNGTIVPPDELMMPDDAQLRQHLNELFAYQINTWFKVDFMPQFKSVNFNGVLKAGDEPAHSSDQQAVIDAFGGLNAEADIHLFLVGVSSLIDQEGKGFTSPENATCWVFVATTGGASYNDPDDVMGVIGHEIGHVFFKEGHPDTPSFPGPAPLLGTDHTKRLMFSASDANSRLIVKKEWDKAEEWLKINVDAPDP